MTSTKMGTKPSTKMGAKKPAAAKPKAEPTAEPSSLTHMTLVEAADAVARGEISSVELTKAAFAAFDAGNAAVNAAWKRAPTAAGLLHTSSA